MFLRTLRTLLKDPRFRSLLYLVMLTLITGTLFYHSVEGWSLLDSFYFSVITLSTVGYGDFTPKTDVGKIFTVMYIFLGLGIIIGFVTPIGEYLIDRRMEKIEKRDSKERKKPENEPDLSGAVRKLKRKL
jgi:voltage-gated potassium channel